MKKYLLDSNIFIQAHRSYYPMDVFPIFWNKIEELAKDKIIFSIDKVRNEIYKNKDELTKWCKEHLNNDFFADSSKTLDSYEQIVNWVDSKKSYYQHQAINEFYNIDNADAFIVAFALQYKDDIIIVTEEKYQENRTNKIKIPDVCNYFEIKYVNTIQMLREKDIKFV